MALLRAYLYLIFPFWLLIFFLSLLLLDLGVGIVGSILLSFVICMIPAMLISWFSNKAGSLASTIYSGSRQLNTIDQYRGNLTQARFLKTQGAYDKALSLVDELLLIIPDHVEGLFLKAQILIDSGSDRVLARRCLSQSFKEAMRKILFIVGRENF